MTDECWEHLAGGGENETPWLTRRTIKLSLGFRVASDLLLLAEQLGSCGALYSCSPDALRDFPKSGYWYACLAGLSSKTLGNITKGPRSFGITGTVKGLVDACHGGRAVPQAQRVAFSAWINDEIDRLYPDNMRSRDHALTMVSMIAGGRVLGQSQNVGGDDAVTVFKTQLVGELLERDCEVLVHSRSVGGWTVYTPECELSEQHHVRIPGVAVFQMVPGGYRPDVVVYPDSGRSVPTLPPRADEGIWAVAEIKGRLDRSNTWESWMPQVAAHMNQWSDVYPNSARLFFGTLLTSEMVGLPGGQDERETLRKLHGQIAGRRPRLTSAYNLSKIGEKEAVAARQFQDLLDAIFEEAQ